MLLLVPVAALPLRFHLFAETFVRALFIFSRSLACAAALAAAHAASIDEQPFVGDYHSKTVDSVAQLVLLDDNRFCFAFMGGSMDIVSAGLWRAAPGGGIRLQEVRPDRTLFPVLVRAGSAQQAAGSVVFDFQGHALSQAQAPVFAMAEDERPPATLRPLFPTSHNRWAASYTLPAVPATSARYFYLGDAADAPGAGGRAQPVKVTQYRLEPAAGEANGGSDTAASVVRVGFNAAQAMPLLTPAAQLRDGTLFLEGDRFGPRKPLTPQLEKDVRETCINPVLDAAQSAPTGGPGESRGVQTLVPVKTFTLPATAVQGAPYFGAANGEEIRSAAPAPRRKGEAQ